jgi:hypothetical protein
MQGFIRRHIRGDPPNRDWQRIVWEENRRIPPYWNDIMVKAPAYHSYYHFTQAAEVEPNATSQQIPFLSNQDGGDLPGYSQMTNRMNNDSLLGNSAFTDWTRNSDVLHGIIIFLIFWHGPLDEGSLKQLLPRILQRKLNPESFDERIAAALRLNEWVYGRSIDKFIKPIAMYVMTAYRVTRSAF